jgi:hypothetical protein
LSEIDLSRTTSPQHLFLTPHQWLSAGSSWPSPL